MCAFLIVELTFDMDTEIKISPAENVGLTKAETAHLITTIIIAIAIATITFQGRIIYKKKGKRQTRRKARE